MCKYACIAHLTLFSDVKRQTRWGQVTLLSHLIIKSWPLQHISLHSGTRGKYLTSCNDCMWQLVGRSDTGKWLAGQYLYLPAGQLTRWKQKCSPHSAGSCSWAQLRLDVCKLTFSWHSGTMNHTLHSPLSARDNSGHDVLPWPLSPCPHTHVSICSRGQLGVWISQLFQAARSSSVPSRVIRVPRPCQQGSRAAGDRRWAGVSFWAGSVHQQ